MRTSDLLRVSLPIDEELVDLGGLHADYAQIYCGAMETSLIALSLDAKRSMLRKLKPAMAAYWFVFFGFFFVAAAAASYLGIALIVFLACAIWLSTVVGDAAGSTGSSSVVWGLGTLFLGPIGAMFFPLAFFYKLK